MLDGSSGELHHAGEPPPGRTLENGRHAVPPEPPARFEPKQTSLPPIMQRETLSGDVVAIA